MDLNFLDINVWAEVAWWCTADHRATIFSCVTAVLPAGDDTCSDDAAALSQALLEAFDKTREPSDRAESGYGAIDNGDAASKFKKDMQQVKRGMRQGHVGSAQDEMSGIESDISSSMKWPMLLGCLMIIVLLCALVGVRMTQATAAASGSGLHAWSNTSTPHGPSP